MEKDNVNLPDFMAKLAAEKKYFLAKDEVYPHIVKIVDAMLEVKGVAYSSADNHNVDRRLLWDWVMRLIQD